MTEKPITDAEVDAIADRAEHGVWLTATREDVRRLVAEVRRLRSDEWLLRAVEEAGVTCLDDAVGILSVMRKHRDGKV